MKQLLLILSLCCVLFGAQAKEYKFNFKSAIPKEWTANPTPFDFETTGRGAQWTGKGTATLTLEGAKGVSEVKIVCSTNVDKKNSIEVKVGSTSFGKQTLGKDNSKELSYKATSAADGSIVVTIARTSKSVYIEKITVVADTISGVVDNNDDEDDDDEDDDDLSYEYESTEKATINATFDSLFYADYSAIIGTNLIEIYLVSKEYQMEIDFIGSAKAGTLLEPGDYLISDSEEENTVLIGLGGNDQYDYGTYIAADFDEEGNYKTVYYIVSGTLSVDATEKGVKLILEGKSYYGSTITCTFEGKPINMYDDDETALDAIALKEMKQANGKALRNGQITITHNNRNYSVEGELKGK